MNSSPHQQYHYVSRGGEKLAFALDHFAIDPARKTCVDLGSHVGGFVDCLLQRGAAKVYSVDTAYGTLAWKLRKDPRVVVMERTNAMHVQINDFIRSHSSGNEPLALAREDLPKTSIIHHSQDARKDYDDSIIDLVTIDVGWTRQAQILPNAARMVTCPDTPVITLIKPHYEANQELLENGVLPERHLNEVVQQVCNQIAQNDWEIIDTTESPIRGHGGNHEVLALLRRKSKDINQPIMAGKWPVLLND